MTTRERANLSAKHRKPANAHAMVLLGVMYEQGQGGPKNDADAIGMFQQASELGYAAGTYNLGLMYEGGRGRSGRSGESRRSV